MARTDLPPVVARWPSASAGPAEPTDPAGRGVGPGPVRRGGRTFLESVRNDPLYTARLLLATTGLRRGELLGLGWSTVDLEGGTIRIERSLVVLHGKPELTGTTKTDASAATIAIDGATIAALWAHRKQQTQEQLA